MAILTCDNLKVGYDGSVVAGPVSFSVEEGAYLCIIGRNGCGKSTLVKTLARLIPSLGGEIRWAQDVRAKDVGYLPQSGARRDFPATVREVVQSGCLNQHGLLPFYSGKHRALAKENMRKLRVDDLARSSFCRLSGGQQQRVLLARALCASGRIIIMDEPVTGLDPVAVQEMYAAIERLNRDERVTVIMVSHDMQATMRYATHILHLDGDDPFYGTTQDYLNSGRAQTLIRQKGGEA